LHYEYAGPANDAISTLAFLAVGCGMHLEVARSTNPTFDARIFPSLPSVPFQTNTCKTCQLMDTATSGEVVGLQCG
jgi:hypothetical protein